MRFVLFLLLLTSYAVSAQVLNLPNEPEKFIEEYQKQQSKQLGANSQQSVTALQQLFQNNYTSAQKTEAINLIQFWIKKGLKPAEVAFAIQVLEAFQTQQNSNEEKNTQFLMGLRKTFDGFPAKTINEVLNQLNQFFTSGTLFTSPYGKVMVSPTSSNLQYFDKKQAYFKTLEASVNNVVEDIGWDEASNYDFDPWKDPNFGKKTQIESRISFPNIQGLLFSFENIHLTLTSPSDSVVIENTSGVYSFIDGIFIGEKGQIHWQINGNPISATLDKYSFKAASAKLNAEKVLVEYPALLKEKLEGILEIKLENRPKGSVSTYPRFKSYSNNAAYILPLEEYDLLGGFTVVGNTVTTTSVLDPYSRLIINKSKRKNHFEIVGRSLTITDTLISSQNISFVARFPKDSVTHPAVMFEYHLPNKHIQLNKLRSGGFRNSTFSDSFHEVDIYCDAMSWNLEEEKLHFYIVAGKHEVPAVFESFDYFSTERLGRLSNEAGFNPLMAGATIVGRKKQNIITIDDMLALTKKDRHIVSNGMLIAQQMGFFDFHPFENYYSLSRKGQHYYFVATGRKDYDDLVFTSLSKNAGEKNAAIDFNSEALEIVGAQNFKLSDSLGIQLLPNNQSMKVIGNKVFQFDGKIVVKNFTFYGDFVLEYENFLVNLNRIDSITFIPLELYKVGGKTQLAQNFKFGKTGKLYLNSPDNKSGRKKLPEYPKLEINEGVTVYFNEKGRRQTFSDEIVFQAKSLKLDSLNTKNPAIAGTFTLGGILQPIQDKLVVLSDTSMGMQHNPKASYNLYNSTSSLIANSPIILNKDGISTSGKIVHLTGIFDAVQIKLGENMAYAKGQSGKIEEKQIKDTYYPSVEIGEYTMTWEPAVDSMIVSTDKGFKFYNETSQLKGGIVLRNNGLFGKGTLTRADSEISSESFKFDKTGFLANLAKIDVKNEAQDKLAFAGRKVNIDFNIQTQLVEISALINDVLNPTDKGYLEFPSSAYKTTIDNALWDIKNKVITMKGDLENSTFTSTQSNQYGLQFNAAEAKYEIANNNLSISGVKEILSADAAILPPDGKVFVQQDGKLKPFEKATIVADTLNRYHTLTNASVTINSKLSYSGNADYQYVNISLDTFNIKLGGFEFAEIAPDGQILSSKGSGKLSTIAKASVSEKDQVYLAKKMLYKGDLVMLAPFKNLSLNGQVLPDLKRYPMIGGSWIDYRGSKSENVSINIDETLKDGGKPLYVGLHMKYGANTDGIYPSFLSMKGSSDDNDVFIAKGTFGRDEENQHFYVKPSEGSNNGSRFYEETGLLQFYGQFNLLGLPTKVFETVGFAEVNLDSLKYKFDLMGVFDFPIPIPTVQKLGQNLVKANLDAGNTDAANSVSDTLFIGKLKNYLSSAEIEKWKTENEKAPTPIFKKANKFLKPLVLSQMQLKWNPTANAYHSFGSIGISNIGDVDINAMVNGYIEIVQSHSTGNELHIFLDISKDKWYYFVYRNGQLNFVSTDEEVNKLVNSGGKDKGLAFIDINEGEKFKKRFLTTYNGISEEEYNKLVKAPAKPAAKTEKKQQEEESEGF